MLDVKIDESLGISFRLSMVERPDIPTAKQKVEQIEVPGRDGSLTKKGAFEDVTFKIKFNLLEDENIKPLIRRIKAWLMNGKILSFTDDTVYRKIKHVEIGDIVNEIEEYGEFEVDFILDPFEYAKTPSSVELTKPGILINTGTVKSLPKFIIYGSGTIKITINDVTFQINGVTNTVVVDSELLEAYYNTTSMNQKMIGEFPRFKVGENKIEWNNAVNYIVVEPRWRYL